MVGAWANPHDWVAGGWGFRASSKEELMYAVSRIGTHQAGKRYVWRGIDTASYRISSSLYRYVAAALGRKPVESDLRAYERRIVLQAREWGIGSDQGHKATDFHILAQLQHEGVPTRLLDVTPNPMTALWFACASNRTKPGVLFAFEVSDWTQIPTTEDFADTWVGIGGGKEMNVALSTHGDKPFMIVPRSASGRLAAQEGLFWTSRVISGGSVSGVDGLSIPTSSPPPGRDALAEMLSIGKRGQGHPRKLPICAIVIPSRVKSQMLTHLGSTYNRSRSVLFPDVGGFHAAFDFNEVDLDTYPLGLEESDEEASA